MKTKIAILLAGSAIALSVLTSSAQNAPNTQTTYSTTELKRELDKFGEYLQSSTNELNIARDRFTENRSCEAVGDAVIAALAYKDMSALQQDGFQERLARNDAIFGRSFMRHNNDRYQLIIDRTAQTEDEIDSFISRFVKNCPDWAHVFQVYKRAVAKLRGQSDIAGKLKGVIDDVHNAVENGQGTKGVEVEIDRSVGGGKSGDSSSENSGGLTEAARTFLGNPNNPEARSGFVSYCTNKGMSPEDANALADAIARQDWTKVAEILKKYPELAPVIWKELQERGALGPNAKSWSEYGPNGPSAQDIQNLASAGGGSLPAVSSDEVLISDGSDNWIDGGARTKPRVTAYYPQGRAYGRLSRETETWKERSPTGQITPAQKIYEWKLELASDGADGTKETFHVENNGQNKERGYTVQGWEVLINNTSVATGAGDKFTVTYRDAGNYEIVASGKTTDYGIPFKVRDTRDYKP